MGVGVAVTPVLLIVAMVAVILVVFLMRRKSRGKSLPVQQDKNGRNVIDNPVYTGMSKLIITLNSLYIET